MIEVTPQVLDQIYEYVLAYIWHNVSDPVDEHVRKHIDCLEMDELRSKILGQIHCPIG